MADMAALTVITLTSAPQVMSGPCSLPSGNDEHSYGKTPFVVGKSNINGPCSMAMLNYQRVPGIRPSSFPKQALKKDRTFWHQEL